MRFRGIGFLVLLCVQLIVGFEVRGDTDSVLVAWRLLDYIAVDYREAVRDGAVINADEYAEMVEFASTMKAKLDALPPSG